MHMQSKLSKRKTITTFFLLILSAFLIHIFFLGNAIHTKSYALTISIPPEFTIPPSYKVDPSTAGPTIKAILSGTAQQEGFFSNFPAQFPDIYAYIKKLFDGVEFYIAPSQNTCPNSTPLQGLTVQVKGPSSIPKPQNITYTINISYSGTTDVIITDTLPKYTTLVGKPTGSYYLTNNNTEVNWDLLQNVKTGYVYTFNLTLLPTKNNIHVINTVCWAVKQSASPSPSTSPNPSGQPSPSGPPNGNYCDPQYLAQYFDASQVNNAACVCQHAQKNYTGGKINYIDAACKIPEGSTPDSYDYFVGLFPIDFMDPAQAPECIGSVVYPNNPPNSGDTCTVKNQSLLNTCTQKYSTPAINAAKAGAIVRSKFNANDWDPWACAAKKCNVPGYQGNQSPLTGLCP